MSPNCNGFESSPERWTRNRRRIYLLRHAEVSYFDLEGRPYPPEEVPLNAEGKAQAEALEAVFSAIAVDRVVGSGLPRTRETAHAVARPRSLEIEEWPALREIRPGPLAKLPDSTLETSFTGALRGPLTLETPFLGGETFGQHQDRVLPAFREILAAPGWNSIAIVAHGGTNRALLAHVLAGGLELYGRIEQDAGCVNIIDLDPDGSFLLRLMNFTPYSNLKHGLVLTTMEKIFLDYRAPGETGFVSNGPQPESE